jgi:hypothetical protein
MNGKKIVNGIPEVALRGLYDPAEESEWEHDRYTAVMLAAPCRQCQQATENTLPPPSPHERM